MSEITFSVVIPTHNRVDALAHAVESVLEQTLAPIEVLIVDNGSCAVQVSELPASALIKVVRAMPGIGASQARNIGAVMANGSHIAFLDDDDAWEPDYLAELAKVYQEARADVVLGSRKLMHSREVVPAKSVPVRDQAWFRQELLMGNPGVSGSCISVRRECLLWTAGFDPLLVTGEDRGLVLELSQAGMHIERAERAFVLFRAENGPSERLNQPRNLAIGRRRYLRKYWDLYNWRQRGLLIKQYIRLKFTGKL